MIVLNGVRLSQGLPEPSHRHRQHLADPVQGLPPSGRADQFPRAASFWIAMSTACSATTPFSRQFSCFIAFSHIS